MVIESCNDSIGWHHCWEAAGKARVSSTSEWRRCSWASLFHQNQNHPNFGGCQEDFQTGQGTHLDGWGLRMKGFEVILRATCMRDSCSQHLAEATPCHHCSEVENVLRRPKMAARGRNQHSRRAEEGATKGRHRCTTTTKLLHHLNKQRPHQQKKSPIWPPELEHYRIQSLGVETEIQMTIYRDHLVRRATKPVQCWTGMINRAKPSSLTKLAQ